MHIEIQNDTQGAYELKWRGVALGDFDGRVWTNSYHQTRLRVAGDGTYRLAPRSDPKGTGVIAGRSISYRVLMEPVGTNVFFLAERPRSLRGNFRLLTVDPGGAVYNLDPDQPINRYEAESQLPVIDSEELKLAENTAPLGMNEYLALPPLDSRISHLGRGDYGAGCHQLRQGRRAGTIPIHPLRIHPATSSKSAAGSGGEFPVREEDGALRIFRQFDGGNAAISAHSVADGNGVSRRRIQRSHRTICGASQRCPFVGGGLFPRSGMDQALIRLRRAVFRPEVPGRGCASMRTRLHLSGREWIINYGHQPPACTGQGCGYQHPASP